MPKTPLDGLPVFVAVAEALSFTAAARRLGISPSAASQAVRALEARLGTLLLHRSTRAIRLTGAGADYLGRVAPALAQLRDAAAAIAGRSLSPSGPLRLTMQRAAFDRCVAPALPGFCLAFPEIEVEVNVEGQPVELVEHGFDAGLRYGDLLARGVIAVKVSGPSEAVLVAAPGYLRTHGTPTDLAQLLDGRTVVGRRGLDGHALPWELCAGGETVQVRPPRRTLVHDLVSEIDLAVRRLGVACLPVASIEAHLQSGALVRVLPAWRQPLAPLFLHYPSRRQRSAALGAFIDHLLDPAPGRPTPSTRGQRTARAARPVPR